MEQSHFQCEKLIIVHVNFSPIADHNLNEFRELIRSTGGELVDEIITTRSAPSPKYFIGGGKAEEVALAVKYHCADIVVFNHDLTPAQERNLEKLLACRVMDRTALILDIFARRARSFEGKLQVELAQLQHLSTRLVRGWTHLERQKGGIGLRGPGETQLETDRRLIRFRIDAIKKQLKKVRGQRSQGRRARQRADIPTISLVGYTNAGKSTLFNNMTQADVYVADQLFATLDPTLRAIDLPQFGRAIVADTVGFIRHLPHELIAAFHATLEETREAALLLHIVDIHDDYRHDKTEQVRQVLAEIGADNVPVLEVRNKIDLLANTTPHIDYDREGMPVRVWLSAEKAEGLEILYQAISERLSEAFVHCCMILRSKKDQALRSRLYQLNAIIGEQVGEQGEFLVEIRLPRSRYARLISMAEDVTV
ncbi:MAG: ribosome rescue GTPase HflX [Pseudomonadota bacterium]